MVAGSQDKIDLFLNRIRLFAVEADLMTTLVELAVLPVHRIVAVRRFVVVGIPSLVVLEGGRFPNPRKGTSHACTAVGFPDLPMALRAHIGRNVTGVRPSDLQGSG